MWRTNGLLLRSDGTERPALTWLKNYVGKVEPPNVSPEVDAGNDQITTLNDTIRPWTPADMTLSAWYDASDASTITAKGSAVSQWADKSGNNNHAAQTNGTNQPKTGTRMLGTHNVIEFDGKDDYLDMLSGINMNSDKMAIIVATDDAETDAARFALAHNTGNFQVCRYNSYGAKNYGTAANTNPWLNDGIGDVLSNGTYNASGGICIFEFGDPFKLYADGTQDTKTEGLETSTAYTASRIGARDNGEGSWDGSIAEIMILNIPMETDRQKLEGYLAHKWEIATNLPVDHPYKTDPPVFSGINAGATLTGTASDADGDVLTTSWSLVDSEPAGLSAIITNPSALMTNVWFAEPGSYTFRLSASDNFDMVSDDMIITVNAFNPDTVANSRYDFFNESVEMYPNPSGGTFTLNMPNLSENTVFKAVIVNLQGQEVYSTVVSQGKNQVESKLQSGMYILLIEDKSKNFFIAKSLIIK
jgi:hypothetical protein